MPQEVTLTKLGFQNNHKNLCYELGLVYCNKEVVTLQATDWFTA